MLRELEVVSGGWSLVFVVIKDPNVVPLPIIFF